VAIPIRQFRKRRLFKAKMTENSFSTHGSGTRSMLGMLLILALLELVYLWLITHGTFRLITSEDLVTLSTAYDSLGQNLLQCSSAVDRNSIGWGAFPSKGRTVMYFGPFPAFVRIAFSVLVPS
jgi:hypothetical protein